MNENKIKPNNKESAKRKLSGESRAHLLAMRKAQAEELALLKGDNFSLEDELHDIKKTLLVEQSNSNSDAIKFNTETIITFPKESYEVSTQKELLEDTSQNDVQAFQLDNKEEQVQVEEKLEENKVQVQVQNEDKQNEAKVIKPKVNKPLTEAQKQALKEKEQARIAKAKEREKEKARLLKEKEKEKLKLAREKEKAKEKARLQREKEKAKEKARLLKEKEKAKEKARLLKEKEKASLSKPVKKVNSKANIVKQEVKNVEQDIEAINSIREESNMKDSAIKEINQSALEEVILKEDNKEITNDEKVVKGFFEGKDSRNMYRVENDIVVKVEEKDSEGKVIIDNLQKLREQIMAQKKLERELMEKEAIKTQQKDKKLLSKLSQIEQQVIEEQTLAYDEDFKTIESINTKLKKDLNLVNKRLNSLLNLSYNGINLIDNDKINPTLINEIFNEASISYRSELKQIEAEATLLIKEHNDFVNNRDIDKDLTLLTNEIQDLNKKLIDSENSIEIIKANALKSQEEKFYHEKLILESNFESKLLEETSRVKAEVTSSLEAKHVEELKQLTSSYEEKLDEKISNNDQYLSKISEERNHHQMEVTILQKQIENLNTTNVEQKQIIEKLNNEVTNYSNQIKDLLKELDSQREINLTLKNEYDQKYNDQISKLQKENIDQNKFVENYRVELEEKFNDQLVQLRSLVEEQKTNINTYTNDIILKNNEIASLKTQLNNYNLDVENKASEKVSELKNEIEIIRTINDNRLNNIGLQLNEANTLIKELKSKLVKDADEFDKLRKEIEDEKKSNQQLTQKLYKDLDIKDEEILKLKEVIKTSLDNIEKLDSQIQAISVLISELTNKAKQPIYPTPIMYPQYYHQDPFNTSISEYERELERRNKESKQKEEKELGEVNNEFADKINGLESQIKELSEILKKLLLQENQTVKEENKKPTQNISKEENKEVTQDVINENLQNVEITCESDIDLISYKYNNQLNKLEISKKFATSADEIRIIDEKIKLLNFEYSKLLNDRNEYPITEDTYTHEVDVDTNQKVYDDSSLMAPDDKDAPIEIIEDSTEEKIEKSIEEAIEEAIDLVEDQVNDTVLVNTNSEEVKESNDAYTILNNETVIVMKNSTDNSDFRFSGSIDQNYINRLNNIRRLRITLENKKKEQDILYNADISKNASEQQEFLQKIEILKNKMNELEKEFKNEKNYTTERKNVFENEKTKLHLELQARQEQLRKLQEDVQRKLDLRYKNIILNIEEQISTLDNEEKEIKDSYLLKKQKMLSKINREKEMLEKLEQEKASKVEEINSPIEDVNPRVIESQEEKKQRLFKLAPLKTKEDEILDISKESEVLEVEKKNETAVTEISNKEKKLALLYDKYVKAEAKMVNDLTEVNSFKNICLDLKGLELEYSKQKKLVTEVQASLKNQPNNEEVKVKLHDLNIRLDNLQVKITYRNKQIKPLLANKNVQDYVKIAEKLEQMKNLLIKYEQKRSKR